MALEDPKNLVVGQGSISIFWVLTNTELLTPNVGSVGGWNAATLLLMLCGQFLTQEIWQESKGYFSFWPSGWERVAMW